MRSSTVKSIAAATTIALTLAFAPMTSARTNVPRAGISQPMERPDLQQRIAIAVQRLLSRLFPNAEPAIPLPGPVANAEPAIPLPDHQD